MVSKYIVDSVLYWAEEYHIDGFRWDLVGLIDYGTINDVMEAVHAVNPDIIFYGEGWEMCSWTTKEDGTVPYSKMMTIQPNDTKVNSDAGVFAFFNDTIRNAIHGGEEMLRSKPDAQQENGFNHNSYASGDESMPSSGQIWAKI